jgi:hypothetical protein
MYHSYVSQFWRVLFSRKFVQQHHGTPQYYQYWFFPQEFGTFLQPQNLPALGPWKPVLDAHGQLVLCCWHIVFVSLISFV